MIQDLEKFSDEYGSQLAKHKEAKETIIEAKKRIQPVIYKSRKIMSDSSDEIISSFIKFMESPSRSISDFENIEFCRIVYAIGNGSESYMKYWEYTLHEAFKGVETFLEVTQLWKGDEDGENGAPVWGLRNDPYTLETQVGFSEKAFNNTVKHLPGIFDVCDELAHEYIIEISDPKGNTFHDEGEFELSRNGTEGWIVKWVATAPVINDNWDVDRKHSQSHSEPTTDAILDWIVKNVWDEACYAELIVFDGVK